MKKYLTILLMSLVGFSCQAHRPHHHHHHPHRHHPVVVAASPSKPVISNRITTRDRMNMAIAYLNKNKRMGVAAYSKMTGLSKRTAEAELDAFVMDKSIPIGIAMVGKKKVYVLTT